MRDGRIDVGVREAVALLNRIPGVTTRASCEGTGRQPDRHRHADLAYVLLRHPMPLRLQDFLRARIDHTARIEDQAVYSRWPDHNAEFVDGLTNAARDFLDHSPESCASKRWPLPRLRAWLAGTMIHPADTRIAFCTECADLVVMPHGPAHHPATTVLHVGADQEAQWFQAFVDQSGNAIEPDLVAVDGWARLVERTNDGDFGPAFQRRWLRYRSHRLAELSTRQLRDGVAQLRRSGIEMDFYYTDTDAVLVWSALS